MGLHRFAQLTALMTFLLLIAGGLVTSTDSGLAVPDWPLSYGTLFPPMIGGIMYEHIHRLVAAVAGFMILGLAVWLWRAEPRRWVRWLGYSALVAVITQAILGGLTVLWLLPSPISVAHACLGQAVFCAVVSLALVTSRMWREGDGGVDDPWLRGLCGMTTCLLFIQLLLGAMIRHTGSALALHLWCAGIVMAMLGGIMWRLSRTPRRSRPLLRLAVLLAVAFSGQLVLGMLVLLSGAHAIIATVHVALGALILASSCALTLMVYKFREAKFICGAKFLDYLALTKPRLTLLALLATGVGFLMGSVGTFDWWRFLWTFLGAALVGAGGNTLNQWLERDADALMQRTRLRPLPAGRLQPVEALVAGVVASGLGLVILGHLVNALASTLAGLTLLTYVGLYTPLKRTTALCTLVGAIPGAMPPLIGWAGARGSLSLEAWVLFAMLFLWQLPHFLAIAWVHREDYARAGFQMLPIVDPDGASTARQIVLYGLALVVISLLPTVLGVAGPLYFVGAATAGLWFLSSAVSAARHRSCAVAHRLFLTSVGYLPAVLSLLVLDKTPL